MHTTSTICHCGLSLCIQGTLSHLHLLTVDRRFIPVYTGNSATRSRTWFGFTVYPCVYRELRRSYDYYLLCSGLSLCIQGTPPQYLPFHPQMRFIPVYTGNSFSRWLRVFALPVYPCVYRELIPLKRMKRDVDGLSLCIQGTRLSIDK